MIRFFHGFQIYGKGEQTRSFQYVSDLVDGLIKLMNSNYSRPVNIGNPEEYSIIELATKIREMIGNKNHIEYKDEVEDDPRRRRPDITVAKENLGWRPVVPLKVGLEKTIDYFRKELTRNRLEESHLESKLHNKELFMENDSESFKDEL